MIPGPQDSGRRRAAAALTNVARLREPDMLAAQIDALSAATGPASDFDQGARAALVWLTTGGPGPLTGLRSELPATPRVIVRELAAAEALVSRDASAPQWYAMGVEHALMWAEGVTPAPPAAAHAGHSVGGAIESVR